MSRRKAVVLVVGVVIVVALAAIGIALANGYLSNGAQVAAAPAVSSVPLTAETVSTAVTTAVPSTATQATSSGGSEDAPSESTTTSSGEGAGGDAGYTATDSTYSSDTASISITQVKTGSGVDTVTYYVADVQLTLGTYLQAGLADGFELGMVDYTSAIAKADGAILAINGDYFTARDTGIIIRNGVVYLDKPAREGLAIYKDGTMRVYDETEISAEQLLADGVWNAFSFGPALVVDGVIPDGLDTAKIEDIGEEHTILGYQPRTAVGMIDTNHFVFVVVDGRAPGYSKGATMSEVAQIFKGLGCTTAYNLDGGGSSTLWFMGKLVNIPWKDFGERAISDTLMVVGS
jgi:exopolysaccharide biosynthesis protein